MTYKIIAEEHRTELEASVNAHLEAGFQLYGHLFGRKVGGRKWLYQVVIKGEALVSTVKQPDSIRRMDLDI